MTIDPDAKIIPIASARDPDRFAVNRAIVEHPVLETCIISAVLVGAGRRLLLSEVELGDGAGRAAVTAFVHEIVADGLLEQGEGVEILETCLDEEQLRGLGKIVFVSCT